MQSPLHDMHQTVATPHISYVLSNSENNRTNKLNDMNINQSSKLPICVDINCPLSKCIHHTFPGSNCDQPKWDGTCHWYMSTGRQLVTSHQTCTQKKLSLQPQANKAHIPATYWIHRNRKDNWLTCTNHANMKCQTGRSGFAKTLKQVIHPLLHVCMPVQKKLKTKLSRFHENHSTG